jgi:pyruvate dehydrogenase E2 component (dihydrolipoyllysine-residue acetyltransferase)
MTIEIKMPALSPTMETGTLAKWLVKVGDAVEPGQAIAEIETDKATMEVEAADEGTVGKLAVAEGAENVPVGAVIAVLLEEGEGKSDIKASPKPVPEKQKSETGTRKPGKIEPEEKPVSDFRPQASGPTQTANKDSARPKASPLARRLAREKGVALSGLTGSGPGGRIVKADLEGAKARPAADFTPGAPLALEPPKTEIRVSSVRKIVAQRLTEAKQTIPHYYLTIEANITDLMKVRKQINAEFQDARVSLNDFIIKAVALALMKTPEAHVQWLDGKMFRFGRADISVAVAIPDGLITPIIRGADTKPLRAIAAEMRLLADKAKTGKLTPAEYQGGTFSISNLGMYGIKQFVAVINPPQSGILAVGAGEERPVLLKDGTLENQTFMALTGSFDHRAVDGATGARLMAAFKDMLEHPAVLLY